MTVGVADDHAGERVSVPNHTPSYQAPFGDEMGPTRTLSLLAPFEIKSIGLPPESSFCHLIPLEFNGIFKIKSPTWININHNLFITTNPIKMS